MNSKDVSSYRFDGSKVTIQNNNGSIRLIFSHNSQRYSFNIGLSWSHDNLKIAEKKALEITNDIIFNRFDGNIDKYKVGYNPHITSVKNTEVNIVDFPKIKPQLNLKDCWELYKKHKKHTIVESTQKIRWPERDKLIQLLESENLLSVNQAIDALEFLLERYAYGSLKNPFTDFKAAINLAIKLGKYEGKNYYSNVLELFPKSKKKEIQAYTQSEMRIIVEAFRDNRYISKFSNYKSSYYVGLVEFRFLTGCRPSEAIAITWDDIYEKDSFTWIKFNKAYVDGYLQPHTKTEEIRTLPCFPQLLQLIENLPKISNENNLIFPSIKGNTYINRDDFNRSYWTKIVRDGLFKDGLISKYLPFYDERHTFITHACRNGVDPQTVAKMVGNSAQVIMDHYWAANENLSNLPDLF